MIGMVLYGSSEYIVPLRSKTENKYVLSTMSIQTKYLKETKISVFVHRCATHPGLP